LRAAFYATKEDCYIYQAGVQYERFLKEGGLKMTFEERYNKNKVEEKSPTRKSGA